MPRRGRPVARDAARVRPRRDASVPASTPASPGDGPAVPVEIRLRAPAAARVVTAEVNSKLVHANFLKEFGVTSNETPLVEYDAETGEFRLFEEQYAVS